MITVALSFGVYAAPRWRDLKRKFVCGQYLRGVQAAMRTYHASGEWDGVSPFIDWVVAKYPGSDRWTRCPSVGEGPSNYVLVPVGRDWPEGEGVVVAFEPKTNHRNGGFVAFANGSIRFVDGEEYDALIEPLYLGPSGPLSAQSPPPNRP